jgi:hypothetical protein
VILKSRSSHTNLEREDRINLLLFLVVLFKKKR